jgi:uncharacterized protein with HEPN domain
VPRGRRARVADILEAIARIETYVATLTFEQFAADSKTFDAVIRNFEVIGEAAKHALSDGDALNAAVPWQDMIDMRNLLVHEYFGIDAGIVWQTIQHDLPGLRAALTDLSRQ